jgi:hypothetical protein
MHISRPNLPLPCLVPKVYLSCCVQNVPVCIEIQSGFVMADDLHIAEGWGSLDEGEEVS